MIEKEYCIDSDVARVFKALTDPLEIEQWSGAPAIMETSPDGEFSLWGGSIHGINKIVETNEIQQLWKEAKWENYSNVLFKIISNQNQTILKLKHSNIPQDSINDINEGWDEYYLGPLKSYLEL